MNLKLIELINNNPNWKELLSNSPYCIKMQEEDNFILLKYDQINSDFSNEIVKECRGIILDKNTFKIVCFPFIKFFNIGEPNADKIDWSSARVQEKIDGSIMKIWFYNGNWHLSTNGCINANNAELSFKTDKYKTFSDLFWDIFDKDILDRLNKDYTYMFELVSPYNRVVVEYDKLDLYHIGTRNNVTGEELEVDIGIKKPNQYKLNNEEEVKNATSKLKLDHEGYVVVDRYYHRIKIKSPLYVKAHYMISSGFNTGKIIDLIRENEQEEFLAYFPYYRQDIELLENKIQNYIDLITNNWKDIFKFIKENPVRKDIASYILNKDKANSEIYFGLLDRKFDISEIRNTIMDWQNKKIIERI